MKNAPKRAAIYCRISKDRIGDGLGVARQRRDCEALAKSKGYKLVAEPIEENDLERLHRQAPASVGRGGGVDRGRRHRRGGGAAPRPGGTRCPRRGSWRT